jgi:hypothetical protein
MKKFLGLLAVALCTVSVGVTAAAAQPQKAKAHLVTVAMKDPGCHWFLVAGKYKKALTVTGPVSLFNVDEAALKVKGASGVRLDRVGGHLLLAAGTYHITMVGQAPDDNHLLLTIR